MTSDGLNGASQIPHYAGTINATFQEIVILEYECDIQPKSLNLSEETVSRVRKLQKGK